MKSEPEAGTASGSLVSVGRIRRAPNGARARSTRRERHRANGSCGVAAAARRWRGRSRPDGDRHGRCSRRRRCAGLRDGGEYAHPAPARAGRAVRSWRCSREGLDVDGVDPSDASTAARFVTARSRLSCLRRALATATRRSARLPGSTRSLRHPASVEPGKHRTGPCSRQLRGAPTPPRSNPAARESDLPPEPGRTTVRRFSKARAFGGED